MALFSKNPLKGVKLETLRQEKIGLERQEKVLNREIKDESDKRKKLFTKGFDKKATDAEKRTLVRQIKNIDRMTMQKEIQHKKISDKISAIDGLIFIKENERQLKNTPFMAKVQKISGVNLQEFLNKASVKDAMKTGKIDQLNKIIDMEYGMGMDVVQDDDSVKQLMDIWSAGEVEDIDEVYDKWTQSKAEELEETA